MKAPTDLEWMMFHDGELEEPRRGELASLLEVEATPAKKLRGLDVLGSLVRAEPGLPEVDLTDMIMGRIATFEAEASSPKKVVTLRESAVEKAVQRAALEKPAELTAPAASGPVASKAAANDNGRLIFGLTGLAAAAAVGLFVWGGTEPGPTLPAEPVAQVEEAPRPATTVAAAPNKPREVAPLLEESGLPAVEVASVDFGSRAGAVIYMDEPKGATTTVVWLTDE